MKDSQGWVWEGSNGPISVYREKNSLYKQEYLWAEVIRLYKEDHAVWTVVLNDTGKGEIGRFLLKTKRKIAALSPRTIGIEISRYLRGLHDG